MGTENQKRAAQQNGSKSKGPVTARGKANSAQNGLRHGMLARTVVLPDESRPRFDALLASYYRDLEPGSAIEETLIEKMVVAQWRQMRAWSMEKTGIALGSTGDRAGDFPDNPLARDTSAFLDPNSGHSTLNRYEISCDRQFLRNLKQFHALKSQRLAEKSKNFDTNPATN